MDKQSVQIAKNFATKLKKKLDIERLILFGSRARGDNLKQSDFDFVIVSKNFEKTPFVLRASALYDDWESSYDIEALCYTPAEFKRKKNQIGIVKKAVEEGINFLD